MKHLLAIAAGGALGALGRYAVSSAVQNTLGRSFPYGTLTVNVVGSFLIGLLFVAFIERGGGGLFHHPFFVIGLLGAFTTFSAFSLDTLQLFAAGDSLKAFIYIFANVGLCLFVCWLGLLLARQL